MFNENKKNNEEVKKEKEKNKIDVTEVTDDADDTEVTDDTEDETDSSAAEDNSKQQTERTFTQKQVNAMMSKEKRQGRAAAYAELGIDPKDKSLLNIIKAITGSQNQNQNQQSSVDQKKIEEAENRAMVAEAKAEAMILGANSAYIDDIVSLALTKVTDDTDIKTVIEELKTKYPVWFGDEESDDTKTKGKSDKKTVGQRGTGTSPKNNSGSKNNNKEDGLGKRLAANRQKQQKSSFWS